MERQAGRPFLYDYVDERLSSISARLTPYHIRLAKRYGEGNLSKGIRTALEAFKPVKNRSNS